MIPTTSFYDISQKNRISEISVDSNFTFSSYLMIMARILKGGLKIVLDKAELV